MTSILYFNKNSFIKALRIIVAVTIGMLIAYIIKLPHYIWMEISIIVVLFDQSTVGGTLQKGVFRVIATIISAIIGVLTLYIFKNNTYANIIVFISFVFIYGYFFMGTKKSYIGSIGGATLAIILLNNSNNIEAAIFRSINIVIGVLLAVLSMVFFLPQYADKNKYQVLIHLFSQLENALTNLMNKSITLEELLEDYILYEKGYIQQISSLNRLIDESKFEIRIFRQKFIKHNSYQEVLLHFRRINRLIGVLIQHIPENKTRFDKDLAILLNLIIDEIKIIKEFMKKKVIHIDIKDNKNNLIFAHITDHNMLFIMKTCKHILQEIKELQQLLNKLS